MMRFWPFRRKQTTPFGSHGESFRLYVSPTAYWYGDDWHIEVSGEASQLPKGQFTARGFNEERK